MAFRILCSLHNLISVGKEQKRDKKLRDHLLFLTLPLYMVHFRRSFWLAITFQSTVGENRFASRKTVSATSNRTPLNLGEWYSAADTIDSVDVHLDTHQQPVIMKVSVARNGLKQLQVATHQQKDLEQFTRS